MEELWNSDDPQAWRAELDARDARLQAIGKAELAELDRWFTRDLADKLAARAPDRFIDAEDLVQLVEWKLKRGTWRPRLLDFARAVPQAEIEAASRDACKAAAGAAAAPDEAGFRRSAKEAVEALTAIKGVGPATASAVLTAAEPCLPYMADEAMAAALPGRSKQYTVGRYVEFAAAMRQKAQALSSEGKAWTAQALERALHSQHLQLQQGTGGKKAKNRKQPG